MSLSLLLNRVHKNIIMGQHFSLSTCTRLFSTSKNLEENIKILKNANAVCFDVDSTVIMDEGIDVLAAYKGAGDAVAELTKK